MLGQRSLLDRGGQGEVYAIANDPAAVYKKYNAAALATLDQDALTAMVRLPGELSSADARLLAERSAWPNAVVTSGGSVTGFLMPRVPQRFSVSMTLPSGSRQKLGKTQLLLNEDAFLHRVGLLVTDRFRLEFLFDTAETLERLHCLGIVVGDFSPNNLCFDLADRPRCYFIDCDAMRVRGVTALPQVETSDWEAPSGEQRATTATDAYKFALLAVRLFAGEQNLTDPAPLDRAGPAVRRLAERGLSTDTGSRPSPADWKRVLATALRTAATPSWNAATGSVGTASCKTPTTGQVQTQPSRAASRPAGLGPRWPQPGAAPFPPLPKRGGVGRGAAKALRRSLGNAVAWIPASALVKLVVLLIALCYAAPRVDHWWEALLDAAHSNLPGAASTLSPSDQAGAVAGLLADSGADRKRVIAAIGDVRACRRLSEAGSTLDEAAVSRAALLGRARSLDTGRLASGDQFKGELTDALAHSRAADEAFASWAWAVSRNGCGSSVMEGGARSRGEAESKLATAAKKRFVGLWNPVAEEYGHPTVTYLQI
ncbi:MAG: hypothetical protein JXA67_12860 [Micromonosporaceae bacterium]|nr:hypothetical protein [Micromonosporaceae bacterium]